MKNHFWKGAFRWASLILTVVITINFLPLTAMAADPISPNSGTGTESDPYVYEVSSETELNDALGAIRTEASATDFVISLTDTIQASSSFPIANSSSYSKNVTLLGNGHEIHFTQMRLRINIGSNVSAQFGNRDGSDTLTISGVGGAGIGGADDPGLVVVQGTLDMYSGVTIKDCTVSNYYGGGITVYAGDALFRMHGGVIENCGVLNGSVCFGGGVGVFRGSTFIMDGGTIRNCFVESDYQESSWYYPKTAGGGVCVVGSTFIMNGGSIENCTAQKSTSGTGRALGGGVAVAASWISYIANGLGYLDSTFEMNGGTISGCTADYGGGIAVLGTCITNSSIGPAVFPDSAPLDNGFRINNGTIKNNTADAGGGVFAFYLNKFTAANGRNSVSHIKNAEITSNHAVGDLGGGMYISSCTFPLDGSVFYDNTSTVGAADLFMEDSTVNNLSQAMTAENGKTYTWYWDYETIADTAYEYPAGIQNPCARYSDENRVTYTAIPSETEMRYLKAAESGYTVTFDLNYADADASTAPSAQTVSSGDKVARPADPTRIGFIFDGWYTESGCITAWDFNTNSVTSNTTLYAKWSQQHHVSFDTKGGSLVSSQTVTHGLTASVPDAPTKEGYVFAGWYTDEPCTNAYDFTTPVTQNITLYAKWIDASAAYTVTFDSKGGSAVVSQTVSGGGKAEEPADPSFTDHVFTGWYTDEGCTIPYDFDTLLSSDITLYAGWKQLKYTMHYGDDRENDETWGYNYAEGQNGYYVPSVAKPLPSEVRHFTVEEIADSSFDSSQYPGLDVAKPGYYFIAWFASVPVTKAQVDENFPVYTDAARTSEIAHNALADGTTYYQYLPFTQTPDRDLGDVHFYAQWMLISIDIDVQVNVQIIVDKNLNFSHLLTSGANVNKIVMIEEDQKSALAKNITPNDVKGTNCKIELVATVADAVNQDEIEATDAYITEHYLGYDKLSYDVAITKKISVNGSLYSEANLKGLAQSIEIEFAVPDEWQNGTVKLLRAHTDEGGVITVEECADLLPGNRQIYKISSDSFSSYSMIYSGSGGSSGGGGSGGGTSAYTLRYQSNGGTSCPDETKTSAWSKDYDSLPVPVREGYLFTGWFADSGLQTPISEDVQVNRRLVTIYAGWEKSMVPAMLNGDDHYAYVQGYSDGTVRPNDNITRAEVATIFFRLLKDEIREENLSDVNTFEDVTDGMWCNKAISTMAVLRVVKGRTAECFDPDAPITRGEFAAICSRFDKSDIVTRENFTDIEDYWAKEEIERAAVLGWVRGYTDGSFRPRNYITRAEAMTMINRVLHRVPESPEDLLPDMVTWPDNKLTDWYYLAVQEATNSHIPERKANGYESWSVLTYNRDWSIYQS